MREAASAQCKDPEDATLRLPNAHAMQPLKHIMLWRRLPCKQAQHLRGLSGNAAVAQQPCMQD